MSSITETESDPFLTVHEAAALLPGRPHVATIRRWLSRGARGIRLECVKIGGRTFVRQSALERFVEACSAGPDRPSCGSNARREAQIARAERELDGGA